MLARLIDVVLSIPFLLAGIAIVSISGPSLTVTIIVIAFFAWSSIARIVRGQVLSIREREYVEAARSLGASDWRIMSVDVLPNVLAPVIVYTTLLIPASIVAEVHALVPRARGAALRPRRGAGCSTARSATTASPGGICCSPASRCW